MVFLNRREVRASAVAAAALGLCITASQVFALTPPKPTPPFTIALSRGLIHDQVGLLQLCLTADPAIYPEGLVTHFFGPLTEKAVQRFQAKYAIVSAGTPATTGFGRVGPLTRAKLNAVCSVLFSGKPLDTPATMQPLPEPENQPPSVTIVPPVPVPIPGGSVSEDDPAFAAQQFQAIDFTAKVDKAGPGGCETIASCIDYCGKQEHLTECFNYKP